MAERHHPYEEYTVGWVCAIPIELSAAKLVLEPHPKPEQDAHDPTM
jgi:hypothetical protein